MFLIDTLLFVGGILLLIGIASSKFSARLGVPVLVLFLAVGMLAGSEGIGGIPFDNYGLANGIGTLALVFILFDGGLRTPLSSFRLAVAPAVALATVGVVATAAVTGFAAAHFLDIPLLEGLLLGSIVGSTDAAAVFAVLRAKGMSLRRRLTATLEIESGSNDPMAVFLTLGLLQVLMGQVALGPELVWLFVRQMALGAAVGAAVGHGTAVLLNRINLSAAGLYPVLTGAAAVLTYGLAAVIGGSGFLAVYLAGIILGNRRIVFQRGIFLFHDGLAWLFQIAMFVVLGLLSFPSRLAEVAGQGLVLAAVLVFIARPAAVALTLVPFRFSGRELAFISWVGLRGAVPIILATFPPLLGFPKGDLFFDMVFFVVLVSALTQGWALPRVAQWLDVQEPAPPEPPVLLEITSLKDLRSDIVEYGVTADCRAANRLVRELALPDDAVIALIARGEQVIPPRGSTRILPGDYVFLVLEPRVRRLVDRLFISDTEAVRELPAAVEFPLPGSATVGELEEFYGLRIDAPPGTSLDELLRHRLGETLEPGSRVLLGDLALYARELVDGRVERVGLAILAAGKPEPP